MPFLKLNFRPGINRDQTSYSGEGGWYECDKIRFFSGYPQKIGGWIKYSPRFFFGTCRQLFNWITSYNDNFLALSTNSHVYIEAGGQYYDITPLSTTTVSGSATFNCTNGSSIITVTDANYPSGLSVGDFVTFSGAATLGSSNITGGTAGVLNQNYKVLSVSAGPPKTYTISARTTNQNAIVGVIADSTVTGGGGASTVAKYAIPSGYVSTTYGYGWGTGGWGDVNWGDSSSTPIALLQRDWWLDNFDNDLVMNVRNGAIYYWERGSSVNPATALDTRAILLSSLTGASGVPNAAMQTLVAQNNKHLLAFGCQPYGGSATDFDPLLIRWSNQDEPQNWTPSTTNSAGFLSVSRGSKIVRALATKQEILVWTNANLFSLQYTGTTDVFAIQELADNISIIAPRAITSANNVTYWMGQDKFYVYSGQVQTLPCTLRQHVFQNFNYNQADQVVCGTNEGFTEIWWFYPSKNSTWNDSYIIFNHLENAWYYGTIVRTAWLDTALRSYPVACLTQEGNEIGYQYIHEYGINDGDNPMSSYIQSSDFDLGDGEQFMITRRLLPDFNFTESTANSPEVAVTIRPKRFSGSPYTNTITNTQNVVSNVYTINQYTDQVFIRARGRQLALKIASGDYGVQWQLGSLRLDVRPDGKR